jgi:hypothetical protein
MVKSGFLVAAAFVLLLVVGSMSGIYFGWQITKGESSPGATPRISLFAGEKFTYVSRVKISGNSYSIWDVRDNSTNVLRLMILVDPKDGSPIRTEETLSKAFAIRLALQSAHLIISLSAKANQVVQIGTTVLRLGQIASSTAEYLGQFSTLRDIERFTASVSKGTDLAAAVETSLSGSTDSANHLLNDPSDENADLFFANLGASAVLSVSQRAALVYLVLSDALQVLGLSPGPWLQSVYDLMTQGTNPSLSVMSMTFGAYESSQTASALESRAAF